MEVLCDPWNFSGETLGKLNRSWRKPQRTSALSPSEDRNSKISGCRTSIFILRAILRHWIKSSIFAIHWSIVNMKLNINSLNCIVFCWRTSYICPCSFAKSHSDFTFHRIVAPAWETPLPTQLWKSRSWKTTKLSVFASNKLDCELLLIKHDGIGAPWATRAPRATFKAVLVAIDMTKAPRVKHVLGS